jgi:hypothetical protein
MSRLLQLVLLLLVLVSPSAFARKVLAVDAKDQQPVPEEGKALVVFMRASFVGSAISASVYDAPDNDTHFIGVVQNKQKMAYQATPGAHRFMVIAENADFLDANLEAGKTYYVLISPRMGVWKARFSLFPIRHASADEYNLQSADFKEWQAKTRFVVTSPDGEAWYEDNKASVAEKKADYLQKWNVMLPADKAELTLNADDGVVAGPQPAQAVAAAPAASEPASAETAADDAGATPAAAPEAAAVPASGN